MTAIRALLPGLAIAACVAGVTTTPASALPPLSFVAARAAHPQQPKPGIPTPAPDTAVHLRYDLQPGDHLLYRQVLRREIDGRVPYGLAGATRRYSEPVEIVSRAEWTGHVLVVATRNGEPVVGFQRNRTRAELLRYTVDGEDRRQEQLTAFTERLPRSPSFAQANRFSTSGSAQLPWSAIREWPSKVLWDLYEIPPLPVQPVRLGDRWTSDNALGFGLRASGWEQLGGERCLRVEGAASADVLVPRGSHFSDSLRLRYWFCPSSGTLRKLEFDGAYPGALFEKVRETLVLELVERRRGETVRDWMARPDLQEGLLAALLVSDTLPLEPRDLYELLGSSNSAVQRQTLALLYRSKLPPPSVSEIALLLASNDPRVRTLAVRVLEQVPPNAARPLLERAFADSDPFVREAAFEWVHSRLPPGDAIAVRAPREALNAWPRLSDTPFREVEHPPGLASSADASGGSSPPLSCGPSREWSEIVARGKRAAWQPPGTTLRGMSSKEFLGWPYGVHVPADYRGDQPFPLLIYLAGNTGPALEALLIAHEAVRNTGYIVLYPNAAGHWWNERPALMVDRLLDEVMRTFNVDPDRIYLSGLSNGGTGTLVYASLWPHRFTAAVSAMGAGFNGPASDGGDRPFAENLSNLPLLFLHGEKDQTIRSSSTKDAVKALKRRSAPLEWHIFKGAGHSVTLGRGDEGRTLEFFQRHTSRALPRSVHFKAATLRHPRHYWIEILEREEVKTAVRAEGEDSELASRLRGLLSAHEPAEVRASIADDNVIRLQTRSVRRLRLLLRPELLPKTGPVRVELNGKEAFAGRVAHDCATLIGSWKDTGDPLLAYSAVLTLSVPR